MNSNEKTINEGDNQPLLDTMSQNEDLSSEETMITSGLQAGINYCRYMSDHMSDETKKLREQLDSTRQINRVLKENAVNLENEKQKLISNFQEEFRKFDSLNNCVRQLEEEMLSIKEFLETTMKLEEDISQSKIEELKIRTSIQAMLEEQEMELQKIESTVLDRQKLLEEKISILKIFEDEQNLFHNIEDELKSYIQQCDVKISDFSLSERIAEDIENIKRRISSLQIDGQSRAFSVETKWKELPTQVKMDINLLRSQNIFMKDRIKSELQIKQSFLDDMKTKIETEINKSADLDREMTNEKVITENLEKEKEMCEMERCDFENKLHILKQEENSVQEVLNSLSIEIQILQDRQSSLYEEQGNLQSDVEKLKLKKETLENNLKIENDKVELTKKLNEIKLLNLSYIGKNEQLRYEMQGLLTEKKELENQIIDMEYKIQVETLRLSELQEILQKNKVMQNSENEEEMEILDELKSIKTEEYSLVELKEMELNALLEKFQKVFSDFTDLEFSCSLILEENCQVEEEIHSKRKMLNTISQDNEFLKSSIQQIKQNVYCGNYVTMQELNKKYNLMVNGKNVETERLEKLKQEILRLKTRLNSKNDTSREVESDFMLTDIDLSHKRQKTQKK